MKRIALAVMAMAFAFAVAACQPNHNFPTQGQGYPDDPKAGEPTDQPTDTPAP